MRTSWRVPYSSGSVDLLRQGDLCIMTGNVKFSQSGENNYATMTETIPVGYRPVTVNTKIACFTHSYGQFTLLAAPTGVVTGLGDPKSSYAATNGTWFTNDPMPD